MKTLSAAIFKICFATYGLNEEPILTCFDKMVNCAINMESTKAKDPQKKSLDNLEKCKAKL